MITRKTLILLIGAALAFSGCRKSMVAESGRVKFRPFDPNAKNVAFIVGAPNDLSGVGKDIKEVSKMFSDSGFGYEMVVLPVADVDDVMTAAKKIGSGLSANSTVLFYFSGHGSESGYLFAQGLRTFRLSSVAKAIGEGYGKGQFKRFIAIMDSCFSGQNVNGGQAMFLDKDGKTIDLSAMNASMVGNSAADMRPKADPNLPFEQALILSAAQRNQTSLDMGPSIGGAFTRAWRGVMARDLKNGSATLEQVLTATRDQTRRDTGNSHTPAWKAMPESMLSEPLMADAPQSDEIFAAIGEGQFAMVFASLPANLTVATVDLCKGEKVACAAVTGNRMMTFSKTPDLNIAGRIIYRGDNTYQPVSGDVLTIVARDSAGAAVQTATFKLSQK